MKTASFAAIFLMIMLSLSCSKNKISETKIQQQPINLSSNSYKIEIIAENLYVPWSIVFTGENRILVTERNGNVRVIENGNLEKEPLLSFR